MFLAMDRLSPLQKSLILSAHSLDREGVMPGRSYNNLKGLSLDLRSSCHFHFVGHFQTSSLHLSAKHGDRCVDDKSHSGLLCVDLGIHLAVAVYTLIFYCLQN